jgi:hypothetical protein
MEKGFNNNKKHFQVPQTHQEWLKHRLPGDGVTTFGLKSSPVP